MSCFTEPHANDSNTGVDKIFLSIDSNKVVTESDLTELLQMLNNFVINYSVSYWISNSSTSKISNDPGAICPAALLPYPNSDGMKNLNLSPTTIN